MKKRCFLLLMMVVCLAGCQNAGQKFSLAGSSTISAVEPSPSSPTASAEEEPSSALVRGGEPVQTGIIPEQVLEGETGTIHYSYYLPEDYDPSQKYPLVVAMPGYDGMWFGEDSSGSNLSWPGFLCWTQLPEEMIVVSAQLTDWGETSARQAIELTEYFLQNYSVDECRVYATGYSAGGETMSRAVALRPDLYAAYLHGASQWDGDFAPVAENGVAVYIFMAESDEYYGVERSKDAFNGLHDAYVYAGWTEEEIENVLQIQTPDDGWFAQQGVTGNYHGGATVVYDQTDILQWVLSHQKEEP